MSRLLSRRRVAADSRRRAGRRWRVLRGSITITSCGTNSKAIHRDSPGRRSPPATRRNFRHRDDNLPVPGFPGPARQGAPLRRDQAGRGNVGVHSDIMMTMTMTVSTVIAPAARGPITGTVTGTVTVTVTLAATAAAQ